jgi:hypothetical protein
MHSGQPVFVGRQLGKRRTPVQCHQAIGLFERGDFQGPLPQRARQHFGITELRLGMRRVSPLGQAWMGFQEFVHKTIEFDHLMLYAGIHRSSPPRSGIKGRASILLFLGGLTTLLFQLRTEVKSSRTSSALHTARPRRCCVA